MATSDDFLRNQGDWGADLERRIQAVEGVSLGGTHSVKAHMGTNINIAAYTETRLDFSVNDWDGPGFHADATAYWKFLVPVGYAGYYRCVAHVEYPPGSGFSRETRIVDSAGNEWASDRRFPVPTNSGKSVKVTLVGYAHLNEGDWVKVTANQDSGATMTISTAWAVLEWLAATAS